MADQPEKNQPNRDKAGIALFSVTCLASLYWFYWLLLAHAPH